MTAKQPIGSVLDEMDEPEAGTFTEPNVVPLIDIMLVLLVTLMATSTVILEAGQGQGAGFRVQLPTGSQSDEFAQLSNELVVAVLQDGSVVARGNLVSLEELRAIFEDAAKLSPSKLVLVQADEEAIHKRVVEVMEAARMAGLNNLAIATKPEQ